MTLEQLIKEKSAVLQSIPDAFLTATQKAQRDIFTELIALLHQLNVKDGMFEVSKVNFETVAQITDDLKLVIEGSDYIAAVNDFAAEFDTLKDINNKYFSAGFPDFTPSDIAEQILTNSKASVVSDLISSSVVQTEYLKPVQDLLNDAVASGAGYMDTLKSLRLFVEGGQNAAGNEIDGQILQYSKVIAHDSFAVADRSYTNAVSDELGLEWYFYDGSEVLASRCFCLDRKGKYFYYKEIQAWGRGENIGGDCGYPWAGYREGTNESTIFNYAGGWNCLDSIMPVSIVAVPMEDIQRNIDSGLFVPSDFERSELNL